MTSHTPLNCEQFEALLPDLMEDALDAGARAAADAHVEQCAQCRGLLADLVELREDAAKLPVLKASRDLWDGIDNRIKSVPIPGTRYPIPARWYHSPRQLAAAAVLLIAVTATSTWTIARGTTQAPVFPSIAEPTTASSGVTTAYDRDLAELTTLVAERMVTLDSATVREVAANMRVIDDAIAHVRAALDANPGSTLLSRQLAHAYQRKVSTLRRVAELTTE